MKRNKEKLGLIYYLGNWCPRTFRIFQYESLRWRVRELVSAAKGFSKTKENNLLSKTVFPLYLAYNLSLTSTTATWKHKFMLGFCAGARLPRMDRGDASLYLNLPPKSHWNKHFIELAHLFGAKKSVNLACVSIYKRARRELDYIFLKRTSLVLVR